MLEDEALAEGAFHAIEAGIPADGAWRSRARGRDRRLRDGRGRLFPRPCRRPRRYPRPGAGASDRQRRARTTFPTARSLPGDDLTPSRFLATDWSKGGAIALAAGCPPRHVAMLARARGVPMVVGLGATPAGRTAALVDGDRGIVVFDPGTGDAHARSRPRSRPRRVSGDAAEAHRFAAARTAGGASIRVMINIAEPAELDGLDPALCDGIGLMRTEFLFHRAAAFPTRMRRLDVYARILRWAAGRPVTIRTLDAGGDKPIPGLTIDGESNPFLGVRGIRLSLARPEVFRVQLRALARAAVHGTAQGHAADGDRAGGVRSAARDPRRGGRGAGGRAASPAADRRSASWSRCRPRRSRRSASRPTSIRSAPTT